MKKYGIYLLLLTQFVLVFGCKDKPNSGSIYFGGEIINPKSNMVLLMKNNMVIDSLALSKDHTFGKSYSNLTPGLYYFKHGYEFQYIYLEPKDSISIRLNTWDFDETLVFDGNGADKNELLIQLFLANERETTNFYSYFSLDEIAFNEKIDDVLVRHQSLLKKLLESNQSLSKDFLHFITGVINYPIYRLKELYPYYHNKTLEGDSIFQISNDFYSFRNENINLNDEALVNYYGYQNYINSYLYNIAYQKNNYELFDDNFRKIVLREINEKIHIPYLKNKLLYQEVDYMLFNESCQISPENLSFFFEHCSDSIAKQTIKKLLLDKENLPVNSFFPDFKLLSQKSDTLTINEVINRKKSVIYFWSSNYSSNEYLGKRIAFLEKKYPELNFVGINIFNPSKQEKNRFIKRLSHQYFLPNESKGNLLVSSKYPRTILIDAKGKVVNNFTLITNVRIEKQLQNLIAEQ